MNLKSASRILFTAMMTALALVLFSPITATFAQDTSLQATFPGSIQQGIWFEQWNQPGTAFCPNNSGRSITSTNEAFTLSAPSGEATISVAYSTSRVTLFLARGSNGNYLYTNATSIWVHLIEVTRLSATQMSVASTFYSKDGGCTLSNSAIWTFSSGSPQQPPPQTGCIVTLTSSTSVLNKRSGPGLNFSIVGQMRRGESASVINVAYDNQGRRWWMLPDNSWVSAAYTTAQGNCPN